MATKVSPRRLTRGASLTGIRSLVGFGNSQGAPSPFSALPPVEASSTAAPTCISGRTSYLWARLEFLRYPQVIPQFCNIGEFGPRRGCTRASPCPWRDRPVSGRMHATNRPLQTRFRYGCWSLTALHLATYMHSPDHSTKGTLLGIPRRDTAL